MQFKPLSVHTPITCHQVWQNLMLFMNTIDLYILYIYNGPLTGPSPHYLNNGQICQEAMPERASCIFMACTWGGRPSHLQTLHLRIPVQSSVIYQILSSLPNPIHNSLVLHLLLFTNGTLPIPNAVLQLFLLHLEITQVSSTQLLLQTLAHPIKLPLPLRLCFTKLG